MSLSLHLYTTAWPLQCTTRKPSTPALSSDARILTFRYIASLPKSTTNWTAPPPPPDSHNQGWTGHRAYRAMPEGPMHIFGPVPPPPSVVGRDGLAIGRFGRFPKPPAVILYLRPPPPVNNRDHPPSPVNNRDHPRPPVGGRSCGCQGRIWFPVQPWSQHSPQQRTPIGGLHLLRLEHIRLHRSLLSGSHFSPKLKRCHSNTTPSSRLPPAGRSGRCKYLLWAGHAVAH